MKSENLFDTIVAIATPHGLGGISVIRVSGKQAFEICSKIMNPPIKKQTKTRYTYLKKIIEPDTKKVIDKSIVTIYKNPHSYTGENVVEISCHGGYAIPNMILEELLKAGARYALKGEFTKRAFLNNKIDLIQAEAVEELIKAKTKDAVYLAQSNIEKRFSDVISDIRKKLIDILSLIEVNIDYPEEELDNVDYQKISEDINNIIDKINILEKESNKGRAIIDGLKVSIVGKTNVGKSSLMNSLMRDDRAIVSEQHGTTRDYLDAVINIDGIPITLIDTAGIRNTVDTIEELGTEKSKQIIKKSDLNLLLIDPTTGITEQDKYIINLIDKKSSILVINKMDMINSITSIENNIKEIKENFGDTVFISALNHKNIDILEKSIIKNTLGISTTNSQNEILVNKRHIITLKRIVEVLEKTIISINNNISYEFIALDIRKALDDLGEITGEIKTDDILNNIFDNFCIGK